MKWGLLWLCKMIQHQEGGVCVCCINWLKVKSCEHAEPCKSFFFPQTLRAHPRCTSPLQGHLLQEAACLYDLLWNCVYPPVRHHHFAGDKQQFASAWSTPGIALQIRIGWIPMNIYYAFEEIPHQSDKRLSTMGVNGSFSTGYKRKIDPKLLHI